MGDDFDLFPKRENLDPFSFGTREKKSEAEQTEEGSEELFGQEDQSVAPPLPDLPLDVFAPEPSASEGELPSLEPTIPDPLASQPPPLIQPPPADPPVSPPDILSDGPISEEKTFAEPVFDVSKQPYEEDKKGSGNTPSPFIVVGGALIIIIGLLYGALTYLKRDKAPEPRTALPSVSVSVPVPKPAPVPVSKPEPGTVSDTDTDTVTAAPAPKPEPKPEPPPAPEPVKPAVVAAPAPKPAVAAVSPGEVRYSVQVGALILQSSVLELEKKLRSLGHEPFRKEGSTTAMMNMLTVGPFASVSEARSALARLKGAGVDSNLRRRADGGAVINAGSYLLEENAADVIKKIRSLGYPVRMSKKEARLPMTFIRVGRYPDMEDASSVRKELKDKGFDAIVVKLQ